MNKKLNVVFAVNPGMSFFCELWNDAAKRRAKELEFNIRIPDESFDSDNCQEFLSSADAIITTWSSPKLGNEVLRLNTKLKIIGHAAGSVADYISEELFERGVAVTSANNDMAHAVAEWCLLGALMGVRKIMRNSRIGGNGQLDWPGRGNCGSIRNQTVGIWGYGAIAGHLHQMLKLLEPEKFLVCSNHISEAEAFAANMEKVSIEELFARSDVIFLLAGLNNHTSGRVDAKLLASIKDGATLVNAGRGSLVQEDAMISELKKNRFTAVLDVYQVEPLPQESPLLYLPNVIMTPHNAGYPSRESYVSTILEEFDRYFRREPLKYAVNPEKIKFMTVRA